MCFQMRLETKRNPKVILENKKRHVLLFFFTIVFEFIIILANSYRAFIFS